jgi:hypothetical protein
MIWIGRFEKFLKVIVWQPRLALEIMLSYSNMFLVGAVCFLIVIVVTAGSNCDPLGALLLALSAAFGASLSIFIGSFRRYHPATAEDHFPVALDKNGLDHLFTRGFRVAISSSSFMVFD